MKRELPVRIREGLGVKLPRATRLVVGFTDEGDARKVMEVLPKRFGKYGLTIHPDKTRLVPFRRPTGAPGRGAPRSGNRPGTFDFLGFTHWWGQSRKGNAVVQRLTAAGRLRRAIRTIAEWCRRNCHRPIAEQHETLSQKLRGHYAYYGITGNYRALVRLRQAVQRIWRRWLSRRSWAGHLTWRLFRSLAERWSLPPPRVVHSVSRSAAKL